MTKPSAKILLVDDDVTLCELLSEYLIRDGFDTSSAYSGEDALKTLADGNQFDAVVLDIMMPGMNGLEVLQSIRAQLNTPVIMLTGRGDDVDKIIGLEMGADDYLGKPCNPRELCARLRAVLRRTNTPSEKHPPLLLESNGIRLDIGKRDVKFNSNSLNLTSAEFNALALLMQHPGEVLTKELLTEKVLHRKFTAYDRSIDVHISRIRQKLADHMDAKTIIKSVRGVGYQYISDS